MQLISSSGLLKVTFKSLISKYSEYYWATAWASSSNSNFRELITYKNRIKKMVVGIHFYQTHPNFIAEFVNEPNCKFIQQPNGTFHPKIYLFYNHDSDWELLVGSANFTFDAFHKNTEACMLISSSDEGSDAVIKSAKYLINKSWKEGKVFTESDLEDYKITWKNLRPKLESLSGQYNSSLSKPTPIHLIPIINRSWDDFIFAVYGEKSNGLNRRLRTIDIAQKLFNSVSQFKDLSEDERKFIAGIKNKLNISGAEDWAFFGSMEGAGTYKNKIKNNNVNISLALDQIPKQGVVTKRQYDDYIFFFEKAFEKTNFENASKIATSTRLLALKRPDTFICLDNKNSKALCKDFKIPQSLMNYNRYWNEIIMRIMDSQWWLNPSPTDEIQRKVSDARVAFLDSIYYKP